MNKYSSLLTRIAESYGIKRGSSESINSWKCRIIYSIAGQMGLASLYDSQEGNTVSVAHMKRRMTDTMVGYFNIYPEIQHLFPQNPQELSEEIYEVFLRTGSIYHKSDRIAQPMKSEMVIKNVKLYRGYSPDTKGFLSGLGMYSTTELDDDTTANIYHMDEDSLETRWEEIVSNARWMTCEYEEDIKAEYLLMKKPYTHGYWVNQPYRDNRISLLRSTQIGTRRYYLYRYGDGKVIVSPLPEWQTQDYGYRSISNACLAAYGTLPEIKYRADGTIVHVDFEYLPPPAELSFIKLYSWPESMYTQPCDFRRVCSFDAFKAIQSALAKQGYKFSEE